jgi:hypothetical protein
MVSRRPSPVQSHAFRQVWQVFGIGGGSATIHREKSPTAATSPLGHNQDAPLQRLPKRCHCRTKNASSRNSNSGLHNLILINPGGNDVTYTLKNSQAGQSSMRGHLYMRLFIILFACLSFFVRPIWSQDTTPSADDVQKGHFLASKICAVCHVAAPDQPHQPIMRPPAPSFARSR